MKTYIYSKTKAVKDCFEAIKIKKDEIIDIRNPEDILSDLKSLHATEMIYCDISSYDEKNQNKVLKALCEIKKYGIIDPKAQLEDSAQLFYNNASDYIGKNMIKNGIKAQRLRQAYDYKFLDDKENILIPEDFILSGANWKEIKSGKEYTFCLMFIELDDLRELKKQTGASIITEMVDDFQNFINQVIAPHNGKVWMWMDYGGLVLLPFDGENCSIIMSCIKLIMNRKMLNAEFFGYDIEMRYRIALHIGNTVYKKRGDTGEIVSDSINSIFHLGQQYAEPGNLYMTDYVTQFIPAGLRSLFVEDGEFEGRNIHRMRLPLGH